MGTETVQVLSKAEKIRVFGEVFTPHKIVGLMCDMLEREAPGAFDLDKTFFEPTCGDGAFVCEILLRKFANCQKRSDYTQALRSVYAMEIQADNVSKTIENVTAICGEFFKITKEERQIINDHIIQADSLKIMRMINDPQLSGR